MGRAEKTIDKKSYQKSSYCSDVPSETYPLSIPKLPEFTLRPSPFLVRDVIYGWHLTKNGWETC